MKLCIIDPACWMPSLKNLFPDADFYSHEPSDFFRYGVHPTKEQNFKEYNFEYLTNWDTINSVNYDTVFIVAPLLDFFDPRGKWCHHPQNTKMMNKIHNILIKNSFSKIALFDIHDYDYDPNTVNCIWQVDTFFKRNYNKTKTYRSNVYAFPWSMFVKPCVLGISLSCNLENSNEQRINKGLWVGSSYNHIDPEYGSVAMRTHILSEISPLIDNLSMPENEYNEALKTYKIGVDLIGVGLPNKRTFEILRSGALLMSMMNNLTWPFHEGDTFSEETFFSTADEFKQKYINLLTDNELYEKCLANQKYLIGKYFTKEWIGTYIKKNI